MSESRVKAIKHQRIRNGEFQCVYCGGSRTATEPEHMPPRILFSRKQRPNDLIFPACAECNRGSAPIDTIIAWLGRSYPDSHDPREREEVRQIGRSMASNYPEVASAFYTDHSHPPLLPNQTAGLRGRTTPVNVDDPYVHRCIEFFGAKFGLAMHWKVTGQIVPEHGRVYSQWFTNYMAVTGRIPADLFKVFPKPQPLRQGRLHTAGRFEYESASDGPYTTHLAIFGESFLVLAFVSPDGPEYEFAQNGVLECEPGCLKSGYPYGLPRLSGAELQQRFDRPS
ncbi:hypothetical protein [Bradyrhizobium sp. F1.13.3]|uniref:hypothetical protein n=1 Tax=Bradyrhizobium sp. F1.13.3 TaxID=3156351 RepID=UPI0033930191